MKNGYWKMGREDEKIDIDKRGDRMKNRYCEKVSEDNRVGGKRKFSSYFRFPTSHTTVRAVRHTAVPYTLCN